MRKQIVQRATELVGEADLGLQVSSRPYKRDGHADHLIFRRLAHFCSPGDHRMSRFSNPSRQCYGSSNVLIAPSAAPQGDPVRAKAQEGPSTKHFTPTLFRSCSGGRRVLFRCEEAIS